jgi:hypothetical protein
LEEIASRLRADEYDMRSFPSDLRMSFMVLAEMARMMHLPGLDRDIEALAKAFLLQVEPLHADLSDIALEVEK